MVACTKKTTECFSKEDRTEARAELNATRPRKSTKGKQRPTYRRRVKPPYSYAELITMAIKSSPSGMLTLREILDHMANSYQCFRGSYVGWKNSVRHNLSANDCFVKVLRNSSRPYGKDNFWTLNATSSCPQSFHAGGETPRAASPSQPPLRSPPLHLPSPSRACSSSSSPLPGSAGSAHSEGAIAPCISISAYPAAGSVQPAPEPRWPSPTPGCMPETAIPAPTSQTCDEWSLLDDLFVPEADIDLALYQDDSEFAGALSTQPPIPTPSVPSHAGRHHSSYARIKTEYTSSYPRYQSADYPPYQDCHGFFPHGVTERDLAFLPYISSDSDVSGVTRLSIKSEYTTTTSAEYSSEFDYRLPHPWARAPSSETTVSYSSTVHQPAEHRLGSIVALAIRGSLSLDFDESALQAIERSVRLLDRQRPDDHMCA